MWSRDALERTINLLLASPTVGTIHIVAHSIGTMVTMEALRQLYAHQGEAATARIGSIVFASPDIDMDVFSASVDRIGGLAPKITIVTATNDRALSVSRWIAGGMTRVGAAEKAQLERLGLRVIDASQQGWGIINHDLFLSNADIRQGNSSSDRWPLRGTRARRRAVVAALNHRPGLNVGRDRATRAIARKSGNEPNRSGLVLCKARTQMAAARRAATRPRYKKMGRPLLNRLPASPIPDCEERVRKKPHRLRQASPRP